MPKQALVEKYRPRSFQDFAGLYRIREVLKAFVAEPYNSAWLFVGDSGTGKTTMAMAMAAEVGAEVHHIPSRTCDLATVEYVTKKCWYVPMVGQWHMVVVDEADRMSQPAQLAFLSKLDGTDSPPNTIFAFTANDTRLLEKRFRSRCRTLRFTAEDILEPGVRYLRDIWNRELPDQPTPDFTTILQESGCNLRDAIMRLELQTMAPSSIYHSADCPVFTASRLETSGPVRVASPDRSAAARKAWETRARRAMQSGAVA